MRVIHGYKYTVARAHNMLLFMDFFSANIDLIHSSYRADFNYQKRNTQKIVNGKITPTNKFVRTNDAFNNRSKTTDLQKQPKIPIGENWLHIAMARGRADPDSVCDLLAERLHLVCIFKACVR